MKTAMITLKVDPKTKAEAKQVAEDLGFSLSSLLNGFLKDLVYNREVKFSQKELEPSDYLIEAIKESEEDYKAGRYESFDNVDDFINHLSQAD